MNISWGKVRKHFFICLIRLRFSIVCTRVIMKIHKSKLRFDDQSLRQTQINRYLNKIEIFYKNSSIKFTKFKFKINLLELKKLSFNSINKTIWQIILQQIMLLNSMYTKHIVYCFKIHKQLYNKRLKYNYKENNFTVIE